MGTIRIGAPCLSLALPLLLLGPPPVARANVIPVTLSTAAGADNAATINAAMNGAAAGDTLLLPAGAFNIQTSILPKAGVSLSGAGRDATTLRYTGTQLREMVLISEKDDIAIAHLTLDGNLNAKAAQGISADNAKRLSLTDLKITNLTTTADFGPHGIYLAYDVTDSVVADNLITNIGTSAEWGAGVRISRFSSRNQVLRNTITNTGRGGILADDGGTNAVSGPTDLVIRGNTITGSGGEALAIEVQGAPRALIEGNTVDRRISVDNSSGSAVRRNGVGVNAGPFKFAGIELVDTSDAVITDNTVDGRAQLGVSISGPGAKEQVLWARNTIRASNTWGVQIQGEAGGARRQYFRGNTISNTNPGLGPTFSGDAGHAIRFNEDAHAITFDANTIRDNAGLGIEFSDATSDLAFFDNLFASNAGGTTSGDAVPGMEWSGNSVDGSLAASAQGNPRPTATILAPLTAQPGQLVQFGLTFADPVPANALAQILWDFDDGLPSRLASPAHAYALPGTYRVNLVAWDTAGRAAFAEQLITVVPSPGALGLLAAGASLTAAHRRRKRPTAAAPH